MLHLIAPGFTDRAVYNPDEFMVAIKELLQVEGFILTCVAHPIGMVVIDA